MKKVIIVLVLVVLVLGGVSVQIHHEKSSLRAKVEELQQQIIEIEKSLEDANKKIAEETQKREAINLMAKTMNRLVIFSDEGKCLIVAIDYEDWKLQKGWKKGFWIHEIFVAYPFKIIWTDDDVILALIETKKFDSLKNYVENNYR